MFLLTTRKGTLQRSSFQLTGVSHIVTIEPMKRKKSYIAVAIHGQGPLAELLAADLFELTAEGIEERAANETATLDLSKDYGIMEWGSEPPQQNSTHRVLYCSFRVDDWEKIKPILEQRLSSFQSILPDLSYQYERLPMLDSVARWRDDLKAYLLSDEIGVAPTKQHIPEDGRIWLLIPPKMAFGTGEHPTTRMAAKLTTEWVKKGDVVLDAGCGTGILALTALALGANKAIGVDLEEDAIREAKQNAKRNGFSNRCQWKHNSIQNVFLPKNSFDLILANIHLNPLREWWDKIPCLLKSGGRVIVTGLLNGQGRQLGRALGSAIIRRTLGSWIVLGYRLDSKKVNV